jgi:hypothetical protein
MLEGKGIEKVEKGVLGRSQGSEGLEILWSLRAEMDSLWS